MNLLFNININIPQYPPVAGSKKGLFVPILELATIENKTVNYPIGLKIGQTAAQISDILGPFSYKSSDLHKMWLNDNGSERYYGWRKTIDSSKQIELHTRLNVAEI